MRLAVAEGYRRTLPATLAIAASLSAGAQAAGPQAGGRAATRGRRAGESGRGAAGGGRVAGTAGGDRGSRSRGRLDRGPVPPDRPGPRGRRWLLLPAVLVHRRRRARPRQPSV